MKATFLFPGQGAQKVGMGADLQNEFDSVKETFALADSILGRSISTLCFEGPEEDLKETRNTQPALFTVEAALCDVLKSKDVKPLFTAGHSLGEYSALYAAGVFSFEDGLKIVAKRGELMSDAGANNPGTMAAIIGLSAERIDEVLSTISEGTVVTANRNTPEQTVISGTVEAVHNACEALKTAGAKRAVVLPVSGAFHSPLMKDAATDFASFLEDFSFSNPHCPVISNVTAKPENDGAVLKGLLIDQLVSPVRWVETVATLEAGDCGTLLEVGPGAVIKGLIRKCTRELSTISCGSVENVYSVINE